MSGSSSTEHAEARRALAHALFDPASIALLGASSDPQKLTSRPQRLLLRYGYGGRIVPVAGAAHTNKSSAESDQAELVIHGVEHAFIMAPPQAVASAVRKCASAGVRVATILTAGFGERGEAGKRRQEALRTIGRTHGLRVLGPNSLGVVNVQARMVLSANAVFEHEGLHAGGLSVVSQSGSMLGAILTRGQEHGFGFAKLVSVGNECDLAVGEIVQLLVDDTDTQAILLFLETFRDAPALATAARAAFAAGKPVLAFKLGRSALGREAAATHTGAIAGDDATAAAFCRAHGIVQVKVFEALLEAVPLLLGQRPPAAKRVCAVTVSGGAAAMVVDLLGMAGLTLAPPPRGVVERLATSRVRVDANRAVIDLPMGRADGGAYGAIVQALRATEDCDVVLAVLGSNAAHDLESTRNRIPLGLASGKPLAVFAAPRATAALRLLTEHGIAAFRTPEACADAIRAYCDWRPPQAAPDSTRAAVSAAERLLPSGAGSLNAYDAQVALSALGIAFPPARVVHRGDETVDISFPVAAKILSPDLGHKTEAGAVVLDLAHPQALAEAVSRMLDALRARDPGARIDGVLVQSMQRGLGELLIGFRRDPQVGAIVLVGPGGVTAELHPGQVVRLAPVDLTTATAMLAEVPGTAAFQGYRNLPRGELRAVAEVVHRLSLLALLERVLEAEINPLIVCSDQAVGVDARIRLSAAEPT
jgi:acyl-CoA synthetase (NDP forming)